ncbi:MAG: acyl carrier protein [Myxococcales bacterium]|nr:acyl carrier protein [Myxococcales bacterium]
MPMPMTKQEVIPVLREHIVKEILGRDVALADDTALIDDGHLASLQTVQLVTFIAEHFGVEVEPEEIDETNFRSLDSIAALLVGKLR